VFSVLVEMMKKRAEAENTSMETEIE
jgi:hypothetical protein